MERQPDATKLNIRLAIQEDLPAVVRLLADDPLGSQREAPDPAALDSYYHAFVEIEADPNNELIIIELEGGVIGTLQLTYIPSLTFQGSKRAQIDGVRVDQRLRGLGIGRSAFEWAIERARERGCRIVQLTTNKRRPEALKFYLHLGFVASHEGLKLYL